MNTRLSDQGIRLREFRREDIPAMVDISNRTWPDDPTTIENEEYFEKTYPPDNPRLRYAVENSQGQFIGVGTCLLPFWIAAPGVYMMWITVDPDWRQCGVGQALLAEFEPYARQQGAEKLWTDCREDMACSIRFLERAGFTNYGLRFESELDLTTFDEARFAGAVDRVLNADFEIANLADERAITPEAEQLLYQLDRSVQDDIPRPGGARSNMDFDTFRKVYVDNPEADPSAILIAKHRGQYAGYTAVWLGKDKPAYTAMTGVRREYRGQGLALALKLLSFRLMKERGYSAARTNNDTANQPILHLNEKLGYQKQPGMLLWEKLL